MESARCLLGCEVVQVPSESILCFEFRGGESVDDIGGIKMEVCRRSKDEPTPPLVALVEVAEGGYDGPGASLRNVEASRLVLPAPFLPCKRSQVNDPDNVVGHHVPHNSRVADVAFRVPEQSGRRGELVLDFLHLLG